MIKHIFLTYHNPLEIILCSIPFSQDIEQNKFTISASSTITFDFIKRHIYYINWMELSDNLALTPDIIDTYADKLWWELDHKQGVSCNPALIGQGYHSQSIENVVALLRRHHCHIKWSMFSRYQKLTIPIIEGVIHYINWTKLSSNIYLTSDIIEHYVDRLDLTSLLMDDKITRQFLITHHHRFTHWINVTRECVKRWPELIIEYPDWPWTWY